MEEADLLILNCTVLPFNGKGLIEKGFIEIKEGKISKIGRIDRILSIKAKKVIDAQGKVALPGLVDCHTHVAMTLFRGVAEDKSYDEWWRETIRPLEQRLERTHVYTGALLGCLEMIRSGITCFADMYFHEDAVAEAVNKSGLRAVLAQGIIEVEDKEIGREMLKEATEMALKYHGWADGRITVQLGPHTVYTCSSELLKKVREAASKLKSGLHIHLAESQEMTETVRKNFGLSEVELLENVDFLKSDVLAAHCIHLSERDMQILRRHNVRVAYNPVANMKLASGIAKIHDLQRLGITVGIGTDGAACNNSFDMFESMKFGALIQKAHYRDSTVMPAEKVLRMGTIDGSKALGLENIIGSLELGKRADLILVDFEKPHLSPTHDFYANLVYSARGSDIDTVIVDGKILMENREVKTLNESEVMKKAREVARNLIEDKS